MTAAGQSRCSFREQKGVRQMVRRAYRDYGLPAILVWLTMMPQLIAGGQPAVTAISSKLQAATVRIVSGTDLCSGVIVSTDGHVLTVAHGLHKPSGSVPFFFYDGKTGEAEILLRDTAADIAVLKIVKNPDSSLLSPVPVGLKTVQEKGQCVFAAGYPGRERNGLSPVVRIGEFIAVDQAMLRSSCTLTVGDSGGPLTNHKGEVVGLHRQIGLGDSSNLHLRIDHILDVVAPVLDLRAIAASADSAPIMSSHLPVPCTAVLDALRLRTVEIRHDSESLTPLVLGTLVDSWHVATKLSELTPDAKIFCRFHDQMVCTAGNVASDGALDLAILKLSQPCTSVTPLSHDPDNDNAPPNAWRIVFASSGLESVKRAGIVTRSGHRESPMEGKLGAVLESIGQGAAVGVKEVAPNSTAARAGLAPGDHIRKIDGRPVAALDHVAKALQLRQPGDWLRFDFRNKTQDRSASAQLQHDPGERFERAEYLDGRSGRVSERRSGFEDVLQFDISLTPAECGGPLCDSNGRVIGMIIARRARESSLAIPVRRVLRLAESR